MKNRKNNSRFTKKTQKPPVSNPDTLPPLFSFEKMIDKCGYSVNCCERDDQAALSKRLFKLSQVDWRDIRQAGRHGIGTETIRRDSLKTSLPNSVTDDVTILAIRFNGQKPMIGYREGRVFYILLLDKDFTAYDHG